MSPVPAVRPRPLRRRRPSRPHPRCVLVAAGAASPGQPRRRRPSCRSRQYVNPFIGTDDSNSPNPVGGGAGGSTVPGRRSLPFGMVQFSPDTPTASPSGYRFSDTQIQEFSLTHFNGAGCSEQRGPRHPADHRRRSAPRPAPPGPATQATQTKAQRGRARPATTRPCCDTYGNTQVELTATTRTGDHAADLPGQHHGARC